MFYIKQKFFVQKDKTKQNHQRKRKKKQYPPPPLFPPLWLMLTWSIVFSFVKINILTVSSIVMHASRTIEMSRRRIQLTIVFCFSKHPKFPASHFFFCNHRPLGNQNKKKKTTHPSFSSNPSGLFFCSKRPMWVPHFLCKKKNDLKIHNLINMLLFYLIYSL